MNFLENIVQYIFPLFILFTVLYGFIKKINIISCFSEGFKDGIATIWEIMPNIIAIMVATALFRETGVFSYLAGFISPVFSVFNIPEGLYEMIIMRPVSGSGSIALLTNIFENYGADSIEGLIASVIAASTETTLYTVSVYFGVTHAKKNGIPIFTGLMADFFTVLVSVFVIRLIFK